jgi:hypothetical protein
MIILEEGRRAGKSDLIFIVMFNLPLSADRLVSASVESMYRS